MVDLQSPNLDTYAVGFDSFDAWGVVGVLLLVGAFMVCGLFIAFAFGREHPFRSEVAEDEKKKPPT